MKKQLVVFPFTFVLASIYVSISTELSAHTPSTQSRIIKTTLSPVEQELAKMSQVFTEVINLVHFKYYKQLTPEDITKAMEDALQTYAHLDPHSGLLKKQELTDLKDKMTGEFCGIGVVLPGDKEAEEDCIPFIELVPNGPAEKAGIKSGDKLIEINGESLKGLKIDELMQKIKGEKNTVVKLKVVRDKYPEPFDFDVKRDIIKDELSLSFYVPEQNICYLLLSIFGEKSTEQVANLLKEAHKKECRGVIIDLRNNTGGLLDAAIEIAGLFLPKNSVVVTTKDREGKIIESWNTKHDPLPRKPDMPIFFIVNNYTASAAEILTGALRLHAEKDKNMSVFIVGSKTFGKGSVQEVIPLSNDSALRLTVALYYLPFDTCVQGVGIEPDFVIEPRILPSDSYKWMTDHYGRESGLKGSIKPNDKTQDKKEDQKEKEKNNTKKYNDNKPWKEKRKEQLANDYLFQNTINLINLFSINKKAFPAMTSLQDQRMFLKKHFVTDKALDLQELS